MSTRAIDSLGDWTFGQGKSNYKTDLLEVVQNLDTRLNSFLGDCFFALNDGIDWYNLLGSKNTLEVEIAVSTVILNTKDVTKLINLDAILNEDRSLTIRYEVDTSYGIANSEISQGA